MLSQKGVAVEERDFFAQRFSEEELRTLLGGRSPRELFATRSPSVKRLGLEPEKLSEEEMVSLMLQEPRLIRRPIVKVGERLLVGGNLKDLEQAVMG